MLHWSHETQAMKLDFCWENVGICWRFNVLSFFKTMMSEQYSVMFVCVCVCVCECVCACVRVCACVPWLLVESRQCELYWASPRLTSVSYKVRSGFCDGLGPHWAGSHCTCTYTHMRACTHKHKHMCKCRTIGHYCLHTLGKQSTWKMLEALSVHS